MAKESVEAEDIRLGLVIWHEGFTAVGSFSHPAVICSVDQDKQEFRVMSLENMMRLDTAYRFERTGPKARLSMRIPFADEVVAYLDKREKELRAIIAEANTALGNANAALSTFLTGRIQLLPKL